ncbi:hypothetical protein GFY24_14375 [Nocardia sp. SYP-A9097]|uniref:hypothetical protein n=1 Tax=Nocardia sp. SYP-A9097 TaxID=2663237 RepID=UPI00129AD9AC|nr:hypothetical protein [Nocardia sp. SYP-A9097]MRH88614.1 hypothetical protein [Nocardia sp. SYP-A9097]
MVVFDLARRRELLDEGFRLEELYRADQHSAEGREAIYLAFDLHSEYQKMLPRIALARCPLTGSTAHWALDIGDLDGWYWRSENPVQQLPTGLPQTWIAMKGAVRLAEPPTFAPYDCRPGPGMPFILPHLLEQPEARAVITELPIGRHTGWAITYFAPRRPEDIALEDLWGQHGNPVLDPRGLEREYAERLPGRRTKDFDLLPWLDTGKLLWIESGDDTATLRQGAEDCPYLGIEGDQREQRIYKGEVTRY